MAHEVAVEIKVNVADDVDRAIAVLGLNGGKRRQVWFLDDLTEGTRPALPLMNAGIVLRLRRRENGKGDSTVKLRPCRRSQLIGVWHSADRDDPEYRIEGDWSGPRHVLAASCEAALEPDTLDAVIAGGHALADAFTDAQHDFLEECADLRVALSGLSPLNAITSTQWKELSLAGRDDVAAERWTVAGMDFLELSIHTTAVYAAALQQTLTDDIVSRGLKLDDGDTTKTERVMTRLAALA